MSRGSAKVIIALLSIGMIVLGTMIYRLYGRINELEMSISSFNNALTSVQGLYSMQQDMSDRIDSLNNQITQNGKMSYGETTSIKGYDAATSSANIDVSFGLKQFGSNDEVYVTAVGKNGRSYDFKADTTGMGRVSALINLPLRDNYTLSYTSKGLTNTSAELLDLPLEDNLCGRFKYTLSSGGDSQNPAKYTLTPYFVNDTQGNTILKVKEITLNVVSNGKTAGNWDLAPYLQDQDKNSQILYNDMGVNIEIPILYQVATTTLSFTDNLGIHYEQSDPLDVSMSASQDAVTNSASGVATAWSTISVSAQGGSQIHIVK